MIACLLVCCLFACVGCSSNCRAGGASGAGRTDAGCDDEGGAPLVDVDACVGQHVCVVGDIVVLSSGGGGTRCGACYVCFCGYRLVFLQGCGALSLLISGGGVAVCAVVLIVIIVVVVVVSAVVDCLFLVVCCLLRVVLLLVPCSTCFVRLSLCV